MLKKKKNVKKTKVEIRELKKKKVVQIIVTFPTTKEAMEKLKKIFNKIVPDDTHCKYCGGILEDYGLDKVCKKCGKKQ